MIYFAEGELFQQVCRCYRREVPWFWYRDLLRSAESRGFLKISGDEENHPFWWKKFEDTVEVTSDGLKKVLTEETEWGKGKEPDSHTVNVSDLRA